MRIGVTYDLRADYLAMGMSEEESAEFDAEITIASLCEALAGLGHEPIRIGHIKALTERLAAGERWDAVFNICEGLKGYAREAQVPGLLEAYGIPTVFSDPLTLALTLDKAWTKRIVQGAGVPTADFALVERPSDIASISLPFPLFLKPVAEGSGKGVSERSRVNNPAELRSVAAELLGRFRQPVLVETYLPGREFTVGITGTGEDAAVLGIMEIRSTAKGTQSGYSYENKEHWEDRVTLHLVDDAEALAAADVALAAWRALRCRDGGRVDVRNDGEGRPNFIEVNPLAGLNPGHSDLCFIARFKGMSHQDLIGLIVASFLKRHPELAARRAAA
ncbi:MAG: D-alanine--D-alanine ligase [Alphaproteobacteria bacterium]|nr:D-alanine--D-alanine ligase [Alphaproteobacteria bacterium]